MMIVSVKAETAGALRWLDGIHRRQIPFATAFALTRTAQAVQTEVRQQLPRRFVIRNRFVEQAIRVRPARKDTLTAQVLIPTDQEGYRRIADAMEQHEFGGDKRPRSGTFIAVPINARRNKRDIIPRGQRPKALESDPRVFLLTTKSGKRLLVQRQGRGKSAALRVLYGLRPSVKISQAFGFFATGAATVRRVYSSIFRAAMDRAIRSAR